MKKLIAMVVLLLVMACGEVPKDNPVLDQDKPQEQEDVKSPQKIDVEQIKKGDFTSVSGVYSNHAGDTFELLKTGVRSGYEEEITNDIYVYDEDMIQWALTLTEESIGGYMGTIYPVGVKVEGLETDTDKIRISYGQDAPMSLDDVYSMSE